MSNYYAIHTSSREADQLYLTKYQTSARRGGNRWWFCLSPEERHWDSSCVKWGILLPEKGGGSGFHIGLSSSFQSRISLGRACPEIQHSPRPSVISLTSGAPSHPKYRNTILTLSQCPKHSSTYPSGRPAEKKTNLWKSELIQNKKCQGKRARNLNPILQSRKPSV